MQKEPRGRTVRILVEVIESAGVERACPADNPMNLVAAGEQELRQVRAVLSGDAGY
jgi:hypothetical protein